MEYPHILREMMRVSGLKQGPLAKKLRTTQPTISRLLNKGGKTSGDLHQRIINEATRLGVIAGAEAPELPPTEQDRTAPLKGYVGAGAEAHFYAVAQGDLDEVPAPDGSTENTAAVEIKGNSLGALFNGFLVFYDDVRRPVTPDLIGHLCVVGLPDDRVLIKKIRPGSRRGLYRLISENGEPIEDVAIEWAAPVKQLTPKRSR